MGWTADRETFDRLMLDHLVAAQRFALRLTGSSIAAEDVVQDALLRAARSWQTFRGDSSFRTWMLRIVINAWHDQHAARPPPPEPLGEDPVDARSDNPADLAAAADLGARVARLVSALPPRQREALVLMTYESLSTAQAAQVMGTSEQNVRTSLHLARQRLKAQLANVMDVNRGTDRPTNRPR
jgi:RNA polymerase sigma-70 factor, ECF subfamily